MSFLSTKNFDKILEYCLNSKNTSFLDRTLWEKLFQDLTIDEVSTMLDEMKKLHPEVFDFDSKHGMIKITSRTKLFYENGGYESLEKSEHDKISKQKALQELQEEKIKKEIENLRWNTKVSKFQVKTKLFPYFVSLVSIIIALFSYFKPTAKLNDKIISNDKIIHIVDSILTLKQTDSRQAKRIDSLAKSELKSKDLHKKK